MKKLVLAFALLPLLVVAQKKRGSNKKAKPATENTYTVPAAEGFTIDGEITGLADGTKISLLNGNTGAMEQQAGIYKNKFSFKGKADNPTFKIIFLDQQHPYLTLFIDNSAVKVSGTSAAMDKALVTGCASHYEYTEFNKMIAPYQAYFTENAPADEAGMNNARNVLVNYIEQHPAAHISAFALIRYTQVSDDVAKSEELFNRLTPAVQGNEMGSYIGKMIADNKVNGIGTIMPNFTQADTLGNAFSLSSLRGKYVLVDFWASWCRPCRMENPNVVASYNKYKDKNFTVLGVSLDKSKPSWLEAIQADGLTWPQVSDLQGWGNAVAVQFKISSIPQNFLIDPSGKIIAKNLRGPALERKLAQLLK